MESSASQMTASRASLEGPRGALAYAGTVITSCDLNTDGVVNSADVQIAIAQVLGTHALQQCLSTTERAL